MKNVSKKPKPRKVIHPERFEKANTFDLIYNSYQEVLSIDGTLSCQKLYERVSGDAEAYGGSPIGVVTVTMQDFIADVELAARSVLNKDELIAFKAGGVTPEVKIKMGNEFVRRKIHPLRYYLAPKDLRGAKRGR